MEKRIMSAEDIDRSLHRIALQIVENNHGVANLAIIGIHTGGVFLADRIQKLIQDREKIELPTGTLDITLYRDDWSLASQNPIVKKTSISFPMEEMVVVLVDDVIFTGLDESVQSKVSAGCLRTTYACDLIEAGFTNREVADMLGHTTTEMVDLVYGAETRERVEHLGNVAKAAALRRRK